MDYPLAWFRSYQLILKWQALRLKPIVPVMMVVQLFTGVGTVIGLGYLMPDINSSAALFLTTGAPTLSLITLGLVLVPQMVAQSKLEGTFEYFRALPIPRMAYMAADLTVWLLATLPGVLLAIIIGARYYDFELQISPLAPPAMLLVGITATNLGYAIAHLVPKAELVGVITNFLVFCLFLFSPINFPAERLPEWLEGLHRVLPVMYAANLVRGTLSDIYTTDILLAFVVLLAWCGLGFAVNYMAVSRRR